MSTGIYRIKDDTIAYKHHPGGGEVGMVMLRQGSLVELPAAVDGIGLATVSYDGCALRMFIRDLQHRAERVEM